MQQSATAVVGTRQPPGVILCTAGRPGWRMLGSPTQSPKAKSAHKLANQSNMASDKVRSHMLQKAKRE